MPPKSSPSDHPCTITHRSKFRQNSSMHVTRHKGCFDLVATVIVKIVFLHLHCQQRIDLIEHVTHYTCLLCYLLMSSVTSYCHVTCHISLKWCHRHMHSLCLRHIDVIYLCPRHINCWHHYTYVIRWSVVSVSIDFDCWPLTFCQVWLFVV